MKQPTVSFTILSLMLFGDGHAFCPELRQLHPGITKSALALVPGQGNQLVAAYTAASCKIDRDGKHSSAVDTTTKVSPDRVVEPPSSSSHWRALAASRSFVARLFHMPSSAIKSHPHPDVELIKPSHQISFPHSLGVPREVDSVLYPIVGFRFVKTKNGEAMALPTTSNAACSLPLHKTREEVVGWYSPACKLDLYAEDPCRKPVTKEEEMNPNQH